MFQFPIHGFTQVVEISVARELFYLLGCGARRMTGESLYVFMAHGELGFYVSPKETENQLLANLAVDEGSWSGAIHRVTADGGEVARGVIVAESILKSEVYSKPFHEYVDFTAVLRCCVDKLVPDAQIAECNMFGRGSRDRHFCEEYTKVLEAWDLVNKDLRSARAALQDQISDPILKSDLSVDLGIVKEKLAAFPYLPRVDFV